MNTLSSSVPRLTALLGKYESNAIALQVALDITDKIIENYKFLMEITEGSHDKGHIDSLLKSIDKLSRERSSVGNTVVKLESYHCVEEPKKNEKPVKSTSESRKLDLEMAVLMQELLSMREDKAELRARIYNLEHEKDVLEMKLNSLQCKEMTLDAGVSTKKHNDPDDLGMNPKDLANNSKDLGNKSKDLVNCTKDLASNSKDNVSEVSKLRAKLKEMSETLERVTRTYELRQMQAGQLTSQLKQENNSLLSSLERDKKKSQARLKRLEAEIILMSETHSTQVNHLKQRILSLEETLARFKTLSKLPDTLSTNHYQAK